MLRANIKYAYISRSKRTDSRMAEQFSTLRMRISLLRFVQNVAVADLHTPVMLLKIWYHCTDGQANQGNRKCNL